jgi:hypothetical protein
MMNKKLKTRFLFIFFNIHKDMRGCPVVTPRIHNSYIKLIQCLGCYPTQIQYNIVQE